ncbi:hypothetical protein DIPPA_17039 [Diplonema papillatum]|nr:hypothetical protein DIPPA_17039 [Diplonema papillatum]
MSRSTASFTSLVSGGADISGILEADAGDGEGADGGRAQQHPESIEEESPPLSEDDATAAVPGTPAGHETSDPSDQRLCRRSEGPVQHSAGCLPTAIKEVVREELPFLEVPGVSMCLQLLRTTAEHLYAARAQSRGQHVTQHVITCL